MGTSKILKKKFSRKRLKNFIERKEKNINLLKSINPFDQHFIKNKFSSKKSLFTPKSSEKRQNLLLEYKNRNKSNKWQDFKLESHQDVQRLVREKQKQSKKRIYNLNDDQVLTHFGERLTNIPVHDKIETEDSNEYNSQVVSNLHFGGFSDGKMSRNTFLQEMIAINKKEKHEKQKEKEHLQVTTEKLDQTWKELRTLIKPKHEIDDKTSYKTHNDKNSQNCHTNVDPYDLIFKDLQFNPVNSTLKKESEIQELDSKLTVKKKIKSKSCKLKDHGYSADALTLDECHFEHNIDGAVSEEEESKEKFVLAYDSAGELIDNNNIFKQIVGELQILDEKTPFGNDLDFFYNSHQMDTESALNDREYINFVRSFSGRLQQRESLVEYLNNILINHSFSDEDDHSDPVTTRKNRKTGQDLTQTLYNIILYTLRYFSEGVLIANKTYNYIELPDLIDNNTPITENYYTSNLPDYFVNFKARDFSVFVEFFENTLIPKYPNLVKVILYQLAMTLNAKLTLPRHLKNLRKNIKIYLKTNQLLKQNTSAVNSKIRYLELLFNARPIIFTFFYLKLTETFLSNDKIKSSSSTLKPSKTDLAKTAIYLIETILIILVQVGEDLSLSQDGGDSTFENIFSFLLLTGLNIISLNFHQYSGEINAFSPSSIDFMRLIGDWLSNHRKFDKITMSLLVKNSYEWIDDAISKKTITSSIFLQYFNVLEVWLNRIEKYVNVDESSSIDISTATLPMQPTFIYSFPELFAPIQNIMKEGQLMRNLDQMKDNANYKELLNSVHERFENVFKSIKTTRSSIGKNPKLFQSLLQSAIHSSSQSSLTFDAKKAASESSSIKIPRLLEPRIDSNYSQGKSKNKKLKLRHLEAEIGDLDDQIKDDQASKRLKQHGRNVKSTGVLEQERVKKLLEQRKMLKHVIKRDLKTARKELRKDSAFLAQHKLQEQMQKDRERKTKVKRLFSLLADQEGEVKALKRSNSKKKKGADF